MTNNITGLERIASGDEWCNWRYKGFVIFDTSCGAAGCYLDGRYIGHTIEEAVKYIDKAGWDNRQ